MNEYEAVVRDLAALHDALSMSRETLMDGVGGEVEEEEQEEADGVWWEQLTLPFGGNWNG